MGNYVSSCSCPFTKPPSTRGTKVILPSGEVRRLYEATTAAELMLEEPDSFIVNTASLQIGGSFRALDANQRLETGTVYVFFPMSRVNSEVKPADMVAALLLAGKSSPKRSGSHAVAPHGTPEVRHRMSICRSKKKKKVLETIVEEPVSSIR